MSKTTIAWRNPYDQQENESMSLSTAIDYKNDPGMTLQAPTEEQDINVIMKRFGVKDGSILPYWNDPNAMYGDFSEVPRDAVQAAEYIRLGEIAFMTLPAPIRTKFQSGAELHTWLMDRRNEQEARDLGILAPKQPEPPKTAATETPAA